MLLRLRSLNSQSVLSRGVIVGLEVEDLEEMLDIMS